LNDPSQLLSVFLDGVLGRSGRKRASGAASFVSGHRGLISASTILAAAGVAWGIYDSLKQQGALGAQGARSAQGAHGARALGVVEGVPVTAPVPSEVLRIVRLAVSAARADGQLTPPERALILEHARKAGVEAAAEQELTDPQPLADIVRGVTDETARKDLYKLAYTIIRADEAVTGGERIYLAQLAYRLGLDAETAGRIEAETAAGIDAA
jgi:uncharacterized membrane protein YebE (DUF533 family)